MSAAAQSVERLPLILFEDGHLLVINKPAGLNTHAPGPYAGEGIYDWLRHREPRWACLAIIHRLDKETSGVMVFSKSVLANRSLTEQFSQRKVRKKYLLLTGQRPAKAHFAIESHLVRRGDQYVSSPPARGGERAVTRFTVLSTNQSGQTLVEAEPMTGRTHQVRVHAAESGVPILGDTLYGGIPWGRVCLHAQQLAFRHPATGEEKVFTVPTSFPPDSRALIRDALMDPACTDAYRLAHGASDTPGMKGWYVDRLGDFLLSGLEGDHRAYGSSLTQALELWMRRYGLRGAYVKELKPRVRGVVPADASPQPCLGQTAPERFLVCENGMRFELSFQEGYSVGLFLDQRDNRRRFLVNHVAAGFPLFPDGPRSAEVLNTFAYTCGFSVCAALAGARTTSLDLSRKYLEWGRRNFALNGLDPAAHDFIYGDVLDWLRRLAKKQRAFDTVVLDPPTFSQSKEQGAFRAEKDYGKLVAAALPLVKPHGVLFAATNAAALKPEKFLQMVEEAVGRACREIVQRHYVPQPLDFPITRNEPAYLKTVWLRLG